MSLQFGSGAVEPLGEPGQVTGRHFRTEEILFFTFPRRVRAIWCERSQSWCTVHTAKKEVMHWPIAMTPTWYQSAKPPESAMTKNTQRTPAASSARIQH